MYLNFFASNGHKFGEFPTWISAFVVLLFIFFYGLYYKISITRAKSYDDLSTLSFLTFMLIQWINKTTYQILNKQYKFAVPFFIYIIFYFWFGNLVSILGFPAVGSAIEIPVSVVLVVFIGTIASGMYYKRWGYINDYLVWIKWKGKKIFPIPDPLKFIGELSKMVSLSCRLWGNCLAGAIILFICYYSIDNFFYNMKWLSPFIISSIVFPLHIYFDIIDGAIQSLIFMLLTMSYWMIASQSTHPIKTPSKDNSASLINHGSE